MIAVDMDGTLIGAEGQVSERNLQAIRAAELAGIEVVVATGRRHSYAMKLLRGLRFQPNAVVVSSNGAVTRTVGAGPAEGEATGNGALTDGWDGSELIERAHMARSTAVWMCALVGEFRNALVMTFDQVGGDGEDARGALVVEDLEELHGSIGKWMVANERYLERVQPIERALERGEPIQMMLCGTVDRMERAEALLVTDSRVQGVGEPDRPGVEVALNRTSYPERDLVILDILPAGSNKGGALLRLAARWGIGPGELMAIGDNWNDLSMLDAAGWPVLMGNAPEDLLAMAAPKGWEVTGRNDEDGVAEAIERVLERQGSSGQRPLAAVGESSVG